MRGPWLAAGLLSLAAVQVAGAVEGGISVAELLSQGYRVINKQTVQQTVPGLPPYQDMPRTVLVTTYDLARGAERVSCTLTYDSQRETLQTSCQ